MAHHESAKKRIRQNEKKRIRNRHVRTTMRSAMKKFEQTLQAGNPEELKVLVDKTISIVHKAASKGVIHKNKAARHVSKIRRKATSFLSASPTP